MNKQILNIIVPCYNEEENVPIIFQEITNILDNQNIDYTIIFVNDGSTDNTLNIIKNLAITNSNRVKYISFSRNFGEESAILAGLKHSNGDLVTIMDADLQHPPKFLPKMIDILNSTDFDNVAVKRNKSQTKLHILLRQIFVCVFEIFSNIYIQCGATDFRLMKKKMVDAVLRLSEYERFSKGIFEWVGFKTFWLDCENVKRIHGKSKWGILKKIKYGIIGITNFSVKPLYLSLWFGILMSASSFFLLTYLILRHLFFDVPSDSLVLFFLTIILVFGILFFCLGILSLYVAKIFVEIKHRPHYIIKESNFD